MDGADAIAIHGRMANPVKVVENVPGVRVVKADIPVVNPTHPASVA